MSFNPFSLISILMSALIAFSVASLGVKTLLWMFKVRQGRIKAMFKVLPFISLCVDSLLSSFSINYHLNPLNCSSCIQKIALTLFFPDLKSYLYSNEISLVQYLGSNVSHFVFSAVLWLFLITTLIFVTRKLLKVILMSRSLRLLVQESKSCDRPIQNTRLLEALQRHHVRVLTSDLVKIPMATLGKTIFMPIEVAKTFPQEEFEAILAHELEHLIWKDPFLRIFSQLIGSVFWWVPTGRWSKSLELDQEVGCDQSIVRYGLDEHSLASSLVKMTKVSKQKTQRAFCYLSQSQHPVLRRLQRILCIGDDFDFSEKLEWKNASVVISGLIVLFFCLYFL